MSGSLENIAKPMLVRLPEGGAPALKRVMRWMLARLSSAATEQGCSLAARRTVVDCDLAVFDGFYDERTREVRRRSIRLLFNGAPA